MDQPFSTSTVTVEYSDPHEVYKLLAPGLIPRIPLKHLHWQSHAGPLRSIDTLHIDLVLSDADSTRAASPVATTSSQRLPDNGSRDDGFHTASVGGRAGSTEHVDASPATRPVIKERRHQIPGLRRTPYLKVLFVRCDDNDDYKNQVRSEVREWIKNNTTTAQSTKKLTTAENHDAFEWMIVHVVIPNTAAAAQPRSGKSTDGSTPDGGAKSTSRSWGKSTTTLLEKFRSDFNGSSKHAVERVAQVRIGINDVPYDVLPRVVPVVPSGYMESERDTENAWQDLVDKLKSLILSSFDMRVSQYEEDIREKDSQRSLPGWNFCTFFILKEGLARGFESVGLVEDALVGYDELSVGLDTIITEQAVAGSIDTHGGSLLSYTADLKKIAQRALSAIPTTGVVTVDEERVDLQSNDRGLGAKFEETLISPTKKPYRELILANNVSVFDFRCYIFARQMTLLLRMGNAWSTREELLAKLKEQQESVMHAVGVGVAPRAPPPKPTDDTENLSMLAEICRRALEFIPAVSHVMRKDIISAMTSAEKLGSEASDTKLSLDPVVEEVVDNVVASYAFSIAQQILAQTSTKALPIPPSTLAVPDGHEPKSAIPEPKTMMHPARSSSLHMRAGPRQPPSPGIFPGANRRASVPEADVMATQFLKVGLEELAARRAELYTLSRHILEESGKKRGWANGWASLPIVDEVEDIDGLEEVSLDDTVQPVKAESPASSTQHSVAGFDNQLLRTALDNKEDFYRLYETLTDKALRHYTVASHTHSVQASVADLAVLKFHLGDFGDAAFYFRQTTPFFGESGWSLLELSMLVTYCKCLEELQRKDEYVRAVLKLLSKAANAERDRLQHQSSVRVKPTSKKFPERSILQGCVESLLRVSTELPNEVRILMTNFFSNVEIEGSPTYGDGEDSFSITLKLRSLLAETLPLDSAKVRMVSYAGGQSRDIWLESKGPLEFPPGRGKIQLYSSAIIPGTYEIDQIRLASSNIHLQHDRDPSQSEEKGSSLLKNPRIVLYQRVGAFDIRLSAAKHFQLDKNHALVLEVSSGWNDITECEIRIRSATGGLRLITSEAQVIGSPLQLSKVPDAGLLSLSSIPAGTSVRIRFPFTMEHEISSVSLKVEATYTTERGSFTFSKSPSVSIGLALGVNVQDVFKHKALFSRFTVSTANISPLRVFKTELIESDVFDSHFGIAPRNPLVVFPKQPASLLYKITRKEGVLIGPDTRKTMYMKLYYSILQDEIDLLLEQSFAEALQESPLLIFSRMIMEHVREHVRARLLARELERAALLGELSTSFLREVNWEKEFAGLGQDQNGVDFARSLATFMAEWQKQRPQLSIKQPDPETYEPNSLLIPVDIPSITIVHTADIRLLDPLPQTDDAPSGTALVNVNQLVPATLHLKWTRIWNTGDPNKNKPIDMEFSFDVTAPIETWLIGGRRKGHFVIPAPEGAGLSSTPDTEAEIPLTLVPLREGRLPFPSVEIHDVTFASEAEPGGVPGPGRCETDYRNLAEMVRVVPDRQRVTLSLDASGPGGGPLVLESEGRGFEGMVVV